jgi:signal peptidase II
MTFALVLMLTTIGCDHITKRIAKETLAGTSGRSYLNGTFRLEYAENPGAFLGLGAELPPAARTIILIVGAGAGLVAVAIAAVRLRWSRAPLFGASLVVAGGASNLIDRITQGSVVDFMNIGLGSLRTGIFNAADVALMLGVALILFGIRETTATD